MTSINVSKRGTLHSGREGQQKWGIFGFERQEEMSVAQRHQLHFFAFDTYQKPYFTNNL